MTESYTLSAQAAEAYERLFVPALFGEWAQRLVRVAPVESTRTLLDVACGTGIVARTAADRKRSAGTAVSQRRVVGLDANPQMLAVAARLDPELTWLEGSAEELPFGDGTFDLVTCQAGMMFFVDKVAALREMARVAGAGTVVVQVPGRLAASAGYRTLTEVAARHAGPEIVELLTSYFAVGEPALLEGLFSSAGLRIDQFITWQSATRLDSIDDLLAVELLPLADVVDEAVRDGIAADCRQALRPFTGPTGAVAAPIEVHLILASAETRIHRL